MQDQAPCFIIHVFDSLSESRQYTEEEGKNLGVTGWVKNTRQGTVVGQVQGPPEKVNEM